MMAFKNTQIYIKILESSVFTPSFVHVTWCILCPLVKPLAPAECMFNLFVGCHKSSEEHFLAAQEAITQQEVWSRTGK